MIFLQGMKTNNKNMRRKHQPAKSKMLAFYYDNGNNNDNNTHTHTHKSYYNTFSLLVQQMRLFSCRFFFPFPIVFVFQ